jgi:integrase
MERLWRDTGIENMTFHDLRHEATSRLFERGFNVMEVASITGHENLKHLKRYTHIKPESLVARLG